MELMRLKMLAKVYRKISRPECGGEAYVLSSTQQRSVQNGGLHIA